MPKKRPIDYMVVDEAGEVWEKPKTLRKGARHLHTSPKKLARRDAAAMNEQAVGVTFKAVPATPKKENTPHH